MNRSLQQRMLDYIQRVFAKQEGAWLVWCDPKGDWEPLLQRVVKTETMKGAHLISVTEQTGGEMGGPLKRYEVQELIDARLPFILHIKATKENLGWLWSQALLAEDVHDQLLRDKLLEWGWKPQSIHTGDDIVARLAKDNFHLDPGDWGEERIQLLPKNLLDILAGGTLDRLPREHNEGEEWIEPDRTAIYLTAEEAGLPEIDEQDLERWRIQSVARLLVTQAHSRASQYISNHEYLIPAEKRKFALALIDMWLDSLKLRNGLPGRILEADRLLSLGNFLTAATIDQGSFLSQAVERVLFNSLCSDLAKKQGRDLLNALVPLHEALERHARDFWGDWHEKPLPQALPWGELARLSQAVQTLLEATPPTSWSKPDEVIAWYTQSGWKVEQAGEEILRHLKRTTTELLNLITPLREAYRNHWETYMMAWSDLWSSAGCPLPAQRSQGEWLKEQLEEKRATAVIVIDALRYDIGVALMEQVNANEGVERAQITAARTSLPTITALGMGMALPLKEDELQAEIVNGKWQLYQQGHTLNLSLAENRREWLKKRYKLAPEHFVSLPDALGGNISEAPEKGENARLFLFDALIDKLGHDEELEPLGTEQVKERYAAIIERLRDKRWERILIVTDHGFIHWPGNVERKVIPPLPDASYSSRRALAYPAETQLQGPQGLAPGGKWRIVVPSGAACFRAYGGLSFFHGGASLQEWIVPCIKIEWPHRAKPIRVTLQKVPQILSLRQKIILEIQQEKFFDDTILPRQVEVVIREAKQQTILFHTDPRMIMPEAEQRQVSVSIKPLEGVDAKRHTPLIIELRDSRTGEILDRQTSTLMVDLENW
jgi:hypothetical protein